MIDVILINHDNNISKTLASICLQSIKDKINIILINKLDNSIDNLVNKYNKIVPIEYIDYKDKSIGECRSKGLELSKNEYIIFMDSGDLLYDGFSLKNLYINIPYYDVVVGTIYDEDNKCSYSNHEGYIFGKLFNRKYLIDNNINFPNSKMNDLAFYRLFKIHNPRIKQIQDNIYIDRDTTLKESSIELLDDYISNAIYVNEEAIKQDLNKTDIASNIYSDLVYLYFNYLINQDNQDVNNSIKCIKRLILLYNDYKDLLDDSIKKNIYDKFYNMYHFDSGLSIEKFIEKCEE